MVRTKQLHHVETVEIKKGVRLMHIKSDLPIATISMWLDLGSRNDPKGKEGMAHFVEHLAMKTTSQFPKNDAVRAYQGANGIRYNAMTSKSTVHFFYEVVADDVLPSLKHFLSLARDPQISASDFQREKSVIEDERAKRSREPERTMFNFAFESLFPGSRFAHPVLGTDVSVRDIAYEDVLAFVKEHFVHAPQTFVISSSLGAAAFAPAFADFPVASGPATAHEGVSGSPRRLAIMKNDSDSVMAMLGFRSCDISNDADRLALQCLAEGYLCSSKGMLLAKLRYGRALTYSVQGIVQHFQDTGAFFIRFSTAKANLRDALRVCMEEIGKLRRGEIDRPAFDAAKKAMRFRVLERCLDPMTVVRWYATQRPHGGELWTFDALADAVSRLTPADLVRVANAYLAPERMSVVLIGDVEGASVADLL